MLSQWRRRRRERPFWQCRGEAILCHGIAALQWRPCQYFDHVAVSLAFARSWLIRVCQRSARHCSVSFMLPRTDPRTPAALASLATSAARHKAVHLIVLALAIHPHARPSPRHLDGIGRVGARRLLGDEVGIPQTTLHHVAPHPRARETRSLGDCAERIGRLFLALPETPAVPSPGSCRLRVGAMTDVDRSMSG